MDMYSFRRWSPVASAMPSGPPPRSASFLPENQDFIGLEDDHDDFDPVQILWSPLCSNEHDSSNIDTASWWTTIDSSSSPPTTVTQRVKSQQHELTLIRGPSHETLAPHHRINVIGHFYTTLHTLLTNRVDSGLIGTFRTIYDLTPSTTWKDFVRFFRVEAIRRELPASIDRSKGERMTVWITAKAVVRKGKTVKDRFVELGKEGWFEGMRDLVRYGGREVRVGYFLSGEEEDVGKVKGKGRREVERRRQGMCMLDARVLTSEV